MACKTCGQKFRGLNTVSRQRLNTVKLVDTREKEKGQKVSSPTPLTPPAEAVAIGTLVEADIPATEDVSGFSEDVLKGEPADSD